ncbi:Uncharacterised protein [Legionella wadsworthii]|uniref:Uncharacterized protein n=1 Tax=Legionella wadsworthii TaxID=28088 RepID=A0A378M1Q3_9GAMM|nr:Uncharacterised protein [Legionella wadsworthii]
MNDLAYLYSPLARRSLYPELFQMTFLLWRDRFASIANSLPQNKNEAKPKKINYLSAFHFYLWRHEKFLPHFFYLGFLLGQDKRQGIQNCCNS